jgi:ketosteroid isomerase-like protein
MQSASSITERNRRTVQEMYDAGMRGDFEKVMACLDQNLVVDEPPFLPYAGLYRGFDGFQRLMSEISKFLDLSAMKLQYLVADGDRVFGILAVVDRATGEDVLLAEQSTLRDGKVIEMRIFYYDAGTLIRGNSHAQ